MAWRWNAETGQWEESGAGPQPQYNLDQTPAFRWDADTRAWVEKETPPRPFDFGAGLARQGVSTLPNVMPSDPMQAVGDLGDRLAAGANGATLGLNPHLNALVYGGIPGIFSEEGFGGGYQRELERQNEILNRVPDNERLLWEGAGAMVPALVTGGSSWLPAVEQGGSAAWRLGRSSLVGGMFGGAGSAVYGFAEGTGSFPERVQNAYDYALTGAGIGAAVEPFFSVGPLIRSLRKTEPEARPFTPIPSGSGDDIERALQGLPPLPSIANNAPLDINDIPMVSRAQLPSNARPWDEEALRATRDDYKAAARGMYDALDESGFVVPFDDVEMALAIARQRIVDTPGQRLPAGAAAERGSPLMILDNLDEYLQTWRTRSNEGVPLGTLEQWRQDVSRALRTTTDGGDEQLLGYILESIDSNILALTEAAAPARQAWRTNIQLEELLRAAERAGDRAANGGSYDDYLRRELISILSSERRSSLFSQAQIEAMRAAVRSSSPLAGIDSLISRVFGGNLGRTIANAGGSLGGAATGNPLMFAPAALSGANQMWTGRNRQAALAEALRRVAPIEPTAPQFTWDPRPVSPWEVTAPAVLSGAYQARTGGGWGADGAW